MSGLYPETVHEPQNVRCKSNSSWAQNNVYVENICLSVIQIKGNTVELPY